MKRFRKTAWLAVLICICLTGCGAKPAADLPAESDAFHVYASFYPVYALADMITEGVDDVNLHCLVQPQDGCLRAYQLSDWDLALLSASADAVLAGGRGLESFESILYALGENGPAVSALLYNMNLKELRAVNSSEETDSHWIGDNPHIYMDADAAAELCGRIAAAMALLDADHEEAYAANLQKSQDALSELKTEIEQDLSHLKGEKVIVMNEALVYADAAYGLNIDLCYERESGADIEGKDLENCLSALGRSDAQVILLEKQAPRQFCEALEAAGYRVAQLDIFSTGRANEGWEAYFQAQKENVQAIIEAFSEAN